MRGNAGDMIMVSTRLRQSGLSLIELMISIVLGLMLVAGATQIFISNGQAFRLQDNVSAAQESGRLGMEILLSDMRRAGLEYSSNGTTKLVSVTGKNDSATTAANAGLLANSDEVTITYRVPKEIPSMSDCEGNVVLTGNTVVNRYFVKMDVNPAIPALFCSGAGGAGTALIRGVESFQVQYGLMDPPTDSALASRKSNGFASPARYVAADTNATLATNTRIAAMRVGILMRSEGGIQGIKAPSTDIPVLDSLVTQASLAAVNVNGNFPVHRSFNGIAALRNDAYVKF
jgi:type IV pilus assembly protein PilW